MRPEDIDTAIEHGTESESVEFKAAFDNSQAEWLEIIKDIIALTNTGGGLIVFGVADSGDVVGCDTAGLEKLDPADLTNKIFKYTGQQFTAFNFYGRQRNGVQLFSILVGSVAVPIVFTKPGTYDVGGGKQKTAFSMGTIYFRHGAKSEPGTSDDLRGFIDQRIEDIRKVWFEGIVKVVEAPPGSHIRVVSATPADEAAIRLVNDPSAPTFRQMSVDETHPYRQKEVVAEFNAANDGSRNINSYHIQCVRQAHDIDANPTFCYKMKHASARFSKAFVAWVQEQFQSDPEFFELSKAKADAVRRAASGVS